MWTSPPCVCGQKNKRVLRVCVFVEVSLRRGDELGGFNFEVRDSDGPGGRHGNLPDQVRESLPSVINHPGCHSDRGPGRREATCNWRWIDVALACRTKV